MKFKSLIQLLQIVLLIASGYGITNAQTYYLNQTLELSPNDGWEVSPFPGTMNYLTSTNPTINDTNANYIMNFWRWNNVKLPSGADGAVITGVSIEWVVNLTTHDDPEFTIFGAALTDRDWIQSSTDYISNVTITNASVSFSSTGIGTGYKAFSGLQSIVQEIIDIPGWQYGVSSLVFITKDLKNSKNFAVRSYDYLGVSAAPILHIAWTGAAPPSDPVPSVDWAYATYQISSITDDAVELDDTSIVINNSGYSLNASGSNPHWALLRWNNVALAQGTQIYDASLTVNLEFVYNPWFYIYGEDSDNSQSLDDNYTISGRIITSASAFYSYNGLSAGAYSFSHFKDVIQEIVDRPGFSENSALSLIIYENQDNKSANATSYEGNSSLAAQLHVAFEPTIVPTPTPTPATTPTPTPNAFQVYRWDGVNYYVPIVPQERFNSNYTYMGTVQWNGQLLYTPYSPTPPPTPQPSMILRWNGVNYYMIATPVAEN